MVNVGFFLALMLDRCLFVDLPFFNNHFAHDLDFNWKHQRERLLSSGHDPDSTANRAALPRAGWMDANAAGNIFLRKKLRRRTGANVTFSVLSLRQRRQQPLDAHFHKAHGCFRCILLRCLATILMRHSCSNIIFCFSDACLEVGAAQVVLSKQHFGCRGVAIH